MVTYVHAASSTTAGASQNGSSAELKVVESYPLTKIRSWKVGDKWNTPSPSWKAPWLKFFLQTEDDFLPITMQGPHAIFLSNCLHAIVNELLRIRGGQDIRRPTGTAIDRKLYELPRLVFYESAEILQDRREGKHIKVQEEETDAAPDSTSDTPTSTSSGVPTNTTDTSTTPTSTTPISDTCTTSTQDPSSVSNATPSTKTTPSIKSTPTTSPTAEAKPLPSESTTIKPAKRSSSSDHPALLTKVKDNVMAMIKRESTTPSDAENITFDFGTDDDL